MVSAASISTRTIRNPWANVLRVAAATSIATIFLIADILTGVKGLAGVLYVPLLVALASNARRREVIAFGLLGNVFALLAFLILHARAPGAIAPWPLAVGLATVTVTSIFLSRLVGAREALEQKNQELAYNEWRHRSIFEQSRFPFWEQDFSATLELYRNLKAQGVTSLLEQYDRDPDLPHKIAKSIRNLIVNDAMVAMVGAKSRADFPPTLVEMGVDPITLLTTQQGLFDGNIHHDGKSTLTTLNGVVKDIWVTGDISTDPERAGIMVGFLVDLTQIEEAQRVLSRAQAELARAFRVATVGVLSSSIAHELNQPLGALLMNAQTCVRYLRRDTPDVASAIAAAERAVHEGKRASDVVRKTRELVTNRTSREELLDLKALVQEVLNLLDHEIRHSEVEVELEFPRHEVELQADRTAFQQLLVNLVGNAVQAMKEHSCDNRRLSITLAREDSHILIEVKDSGPGIADEHLKRLFEPFFTTKEGGVGIGLAISRSAVEARGGVLHAYNGKAGGAVFACRIPLDRTV